MSLVTAAACIGPWAGVVRAAPIHNTFNDVWIDKETQHWYDNLAEAGANERRQANNRDVEQMDAMMSMFMNIMLERQIKRERGRQVLKRDEASTGFTPVKGSPVAARMIAKLGAAAAADPKQREAVMREVVGRLGAFQAAAAARGGVVKSDVADIYAVAFVLNYEVLNDGGEMPGAARRRSLAERFRARLMADEEFQGTVDADRQAYAEHAAYAAVWAVDQLAAAKRANDPYVRRVARDQALTNLGQFKGLWPYPVSGIELTPDGFGDRGERLKAQGRLTTAFGATPQPLLPAELAATPANAGGGAAASQQVANELRAFADQAKRAGARTDDLAQASALCVKLYYHVYSGGQDLSERQFASVVKISAGYYLSDPMWMGLADEGRQRAIEQAAVGAERLWQEYRRIVEVETPAKIAEWKRISGGDTSRFGSLAGWPDQTVRWEAKRRLDAMFAFGGLKFDDYTLTEDGLEPRRGQRLIKEGKTTTAFRRAPQALLPARFAAGPDAGGLGPAAARQAADDLKAFADLTRGRRAPADDMAHAAALAVSVHYAVLSGGAQLSDRQYQSLVKLLGRRYVEDPAWAALPDAARQELAETWAIRAVRNWREYRQKVDVEIPRARAEKAAMFHNVDARTLDSWVASMPDWAKSESRRQIESLFAPLKLDGYRLTDEGFVPAAAGR
ncbi:MAG TPA: DUF6683 family protein [Tepidisphaeraceae bacterium]